MRKCTKPVFREAILSPPPNSFFSLSLFFCLSLSLSLYILCAEHLITHKKRKHHFYQLTSHTQRRILHGSFHLQASHIHMWHDAYEYTSNELCHSICSRLFYLVVMCVCVMLLTSNSAQKSGKVKNILNIQSSRYIELCGKIPQNGHFSDSPYFYLLSFGLFCVCV